MILGGGPALSSFGPGYWTTGTGIRPTRITYRYFLFGIGRRPVN